MIDLKETGRHAEEKFNEFLSYGVGKFNMRDQIQSLLGESKVSAIYPKNIFEEGNDNKTYYAFHSKAISIIKRGKEDSTIETHPLEIKEVFFKRSNQIAVGEPILNVYLESGCILEFRITDSNQYWRREYMTLIEELHSEFLKII
ncbi:hypothetical protein [Planococcus rifietoensis]|uniref:hypothetical protein n=1 Tax=Planococcus rifietoensis TaxID=200991 RepID=UPI00384A6180